MKKKMAIFEQDAATQLTALQTAQDSEYSCPRQQGNRSTSNTKTFDKFILEMETPCISESIDMFKINMWQIFLNAGH